MTRCHTRLKVAFAIFAISDWHLSWATFAVCQRVISPSGFRRCSGTRNPHEKTQNGYNAALWNCRSVLRGYATMGFRQGYAYDPSLTVRDALPFNPLMRNFKLNSVFYDRERRAFDRIELDSRSAKRGDSRRPRRSRRKDENSKRDRRSRADSVETSRTTTVVCVPLKTSMNQKIWLKVYQNPCLSPAGRISVPSVSNSCHTAQNQIYCSGYRPRPANIFAIISACAASRAVSFGSMPSIEPARAISTISQQAVKRGVSPSVA